MRVGRLFRTVRHLRREQFVNRLRRTLLRPRPRPMAPLQPRRPEAALVPFLPRAASWDGGTRFDLLNLGADFATAQPWHRPDMPHLWRYHLHYHEDLLRADAAVWRDRHAALIADWIAANPFGVPDAWDPYPSSLRSVAWTKWHLISGGLDSAALESLAVQLGLLERNLEYHLLGNHLWANAKALSLAGLAFDGPDAARWREAGLALWARERREQILGDGGHFERSPTYHALMTEDLLDLINLAAALDVSLAPAWRETAAAMLGWLAVMTRPDGVPLLWNDATADMAPGLAALADYAAALGIEPRASGPTLSDSGYSRFAIGAAHLWFDHGDIGPDYIPGHAHADTLAIELWARGGPVFTDSGVSTYAAGARRALERGTAAHNTVCLEGEDSSELWAAFRVGRRARPCAVQIVPGRAEAAHDGYRHRGVRHRRSLAFASGQLSITDMMEGPDRPATAAFHLGPGLGAVADGMTVQLSNGMTMALSGATQITVEAVEMADGFNRLRPGLCIRAAFQQRLETRITL